MSRVVEDRDVWRAVFENAPDAVLVADDEGRYIAANAAASALTGFSRDELLGLSVWSLTPDSGRERGLAIWRSFIAQGRLSGEYRLRRKDGTEISVHYDAVANAAPGMHLSMLRRPGDGGGRAEVLEAIRDALAGDAEVATRDALLIRLTLLQELTAALAAASLPEDILRAVFEHGRNLLHVRAVSLYLAEAGDLTLRASHGLPAATTQKYTRIPFDHASPVAQAFRDGSVLWIPSQQIFDQLYPELAVARSPSSGAWAVLPLRSGGKPVGVLGFVFPDAHTWTEQQKAMIEAVGSIVSQALERSRLLDSERRARELQERLMAIVGHDLRNPLQAVFAAVGMIQRADGRDVIERNARRVLDSARRMTAIIDDLLDYARAASGAGLSTVRGRTDAHEVVERVVGELQAVHPERRIALQTSGPGAGSFDGRRIGQLVSNLVSNAIHYGLKDEGVEVSSTGSDLSWELSVHNAGTPIDPAVLAKLFSPFQRGEGSARAYGGGLGLGLYIVDEIVRAHGGKIDVRSSEGEGTTFRVRLPRAI